MVKVSLPKNNPSTTKIHVTKKQWLFLVALILIVTTGVLAPAVIYYQTVRAPLIEKRDNIVQNGTETEAISNGKSVRSRRDGDGLRRSHIGSYAEYIYKTSDGAIHTVIGTRRYTIQNDIIKGIKATVKYLYVDGQLQATVTKEDLHSYTNQKL